MELLQHAELRSAPTAQHLRKLYFTRAAFSAVWITLVLLLAKNNPQAAAVLLIVYPAWDLLATLWDIGFNPDKGSRLPQYVNATISAIVTIAIALAIQKGLPQALIVFGVWAGGTGIIQLIMGLIRRRQLGGQWPMIISGAQSVLAGVSFIVKAHDPAMGIVNLAGYSAFGAFYYILSAVRLSRAITNERNKELEA